MYIIILGGDFICVFNLRYAVQNILMKNKIWFMSFNYRQACSTFAIEILINGKT